MPSIRPMKHSFVRGEISDKLLARQDWDGWHDASHCLENVVVQVQGGATRRAGSAFVAEAKDSTHAVRLERFVYDVSTAYTLEFGHEYLRFYTNRALLRQPDTEPLAYLSVSVSGSTATITTDADVLSATSADRGREITLLDGGFLQIVSVVDARTAIADVIEDPVGTGPYAPSQWRITGAPVEVATPYQGDEVFEVHARAQSADVLYLFHRAYAPRKLVRITETQFELRTVNFNPPATAEIGDEPAVAVTLSAVSGSGVTATTSGVYWLAGDVGRAVRYEAGYAIISSVTSGTVAVLEIQDAFASTAIPAGEWRLEGSPRAYFGCEATNEGWIGTASLWDTDRRVSFGSPVEGFRPSDVGRHIIAWGGFATILAYQDATAVTIRIDDTFIDHGQEVWYYDPQVMLWPRLAPGLWTLESIAWSDDLGWPRCGDFHQDRLAVGSRMVWLSQSGDYENFAGGAIDSASITRSLPGQDECLWLKSADKVLAAGTASREIGIEGGSDKVVTPSACTAREKSHYGSDAVDPISVGSAVLFAQRGGHSLRELIGNFDIEQWQAPSLSLISEHLFRPGSIVQLAAVTVPDTVLLAVTSDGMLLTNTYEQPEKLTTCWTHHITLGDYESVCVVPYPGGEEVYVVVRRTVGGIPKRYVEVFDGSLNTDAALVLEDEDGVEEIRGLRHLEGQSVTYKVNASVDANGYKTGGTAYAGTVTSGVLVLGVTATTVEVGLAYASKWIPVAPEIRTEIGTIQGRRSRWSELVARWYCTEGTPTINGEAWRLPETATTPYTGDTRCTEQGWVRMHGKPQVMIEQATPFAATLLGLTGRLELDDG